MSAQLDQLVQAKTLAMATQPGSMLPRVLDTAASLYLSSSLRTPPMGRFCSQLLLDVLSHEQISSSDKPFIASQHLNLLWQLCNDSPDYVTYKNVVLAFGCCYDWLFDLVAKTSNKELWNTMCQLKRFIISKWSTSFPLRRDDDDANGDDIQSDGSEQNMIDPATSIGVKLATAKLMSKLIIVHTTGSGISIASVPESHPIITPRSSIESEAKRLLDVLLNYLVDEPIMVAPLFIGILNCLSFVMKQRPQSTMRILSGLLKFNVDMKYQRDSEPTLQYRLAKRFVERCYRNFVNFGLRSQLIKNSGNTAQYHARLTKISQTLHVIGEETRAKGILNYDEKQVEHKMSERDKAKYYQKKKKKMMSKSSSVTTPQTPSVPTIPLDIQVLMNLQKYAMSKTSTTAFFNTSPVAFDNSYASVYSLMNSKHSEMDVSKLSQEVMVKLCTEALYQTDTNKMISGLSIVASRYTDLMNKTMQQQDGSRKRSADEIQDDKITVKKRATDMATPNAASTQDLEEDDEEKQDFWLGPPKILSDSEKHQLLSRVVERIMSIKDLEDDNGNDTATSQNELSSAFLARIRFSEWDNKTSWLTLLTRMATRGLSHTPDMCDVVRDAIYEYFVEDFSNRIAVVIEWLSEEWYYETLITNGRSTEVYDKWSLKVLDGLVPFLENSHRRLFIRLVSELPRLSQSHIDRIKSLCLDPLRSSLGFQSLKFMLMFRPPAKPLISNILQDMKQQDEGVREQCDSILTKFF